MEIMTWAVRMLIAFLVGIIAWIGRGTEARMTTLERTVSAMDDSLASMRWGQRDVVRHLDRIDKNMDEWLTVVREERTRWRHQ